MKDKLGQELAIGDEIIFATGVRETEIAQIISMGEKMLVVGIQKKNYRGDTYLTKTKRYPSEVLKLGGGSNTEKVSTMPEDIAKTLTHALRLASGVIPTRRLENADKWVNDLIWTKE